MREMTEQRKEPAFSLLENEIDRSGDVPRNPRTTEERHHCESCHVDVAWVFLICAILLLGMMLLRHYEIKEIRAEERRAERARIVAEIEHFGKIEGHQVAWYSVKERTRKP